MDRYKKNPLCLGALDIGGTKISIGIADESGRIIASEKIKTEKDPEAAMKTAAEYLKNMSELRSCKLEAVGVSCAGPVDTVTGKVNNPYTLPGWEEYPLTERLSELSGVAVKLENDANCALLGEVQLSGLRPGQGRQHPGRGGEGALIGVELDVLLVLGLLTGGVGFQAFQLGGKITAHGRRPSS